MKSWNYGVSLLAALGLVGPAASADAAVWSTNWTQAAAVATQQNKPLLIDFSASWCGPCKLMARTTLQDETVRRALERFVPVAVDIDASPRLAEAHGVSAVPTFVVLHPDGDELQRTSGYMDAERFRGWLATGAQKFAEGQARKRLFQEQQQALQASLAGSDATKRRAAVGQLLDLCARREQSEQAYAAAQLKTLAAREPALLFPGLMHTNLATRIHAANALRERLGEGFVFDPWETPARRAQQSAALQEAFTPEKKE